MTDLPQSLAMLRALSSAWGIRASRTAVGNYTAVFARDGVMAGLAGLAAGEADLSAALVAVLTHLRDLQGADGQIASNYRLPDDGGASVVSFGSLAPRYDAAGWFLVGSGLAVRAGLLPATALREAVGRTVRCLDAIEYNDRDLLYVPAGGNWADEYVTEGYSLYDQVLRAWGLRCCASAFSEPAWAHKAERIGRAMERHYWPLDGAGLPPALRTAIRPDRRHPLASFTPLGVVDRRDLAAIALLGVSGTAPALAERALDALVADTLDAGRLPPAFAPVIAEGDPLWPALQGYWLYEFKNHPHHYHNGGIWPIWLGWLGLALARTGRRTALATLRRLTAAATDRSDFRFDEYLAGDTLAPAGPPELAYTASGLVLLALAESPTAHRVFDA